jgi:hypothetical protein
MSDALGTAGETHGATSIRIGKSDLAERVFGLTPAYHSRYSQDSAFLGQVSPKMIDTAIIVSRIVSGVRLLLLALSVAIPGLVLAPQHSGG